VNASTSKPYHHGDLRQALLTEAERILEQEGVQALTLRATARAAGVSHTAPKNHFGDLSGLLSELAADGYRRLAATMAEGLEAGGADPRRRLRSMGRAYVSFVQANPGLFTLMFRSERLDSARPALQEAIVAIRAVLRDAVGAVTPTDTSTRPLETVARITAVWSLVHGFAMLMIEGRLRNAMAVAGVETPEQLFEAVIGALTLNGAD
jgi:AcrR family transcriptional regulator